VAGVKIGKITLGGYQTNCYLLYKENGDTLVVDPADKGEYIYQKLKDNGLNVKAILLTHGHFDHIFGVSELKRLTNAKVYAYTEEKELLLDPNLNVSDMVGRPTAIVPDVLLNDGEEVSVEGFDFRVIHTPGHTQGSACYYFKDEDILISGDTLFMESIGRSDLPTGNENKLLLSLNNVLMKLPDNTEVFPGHGPKTTIGYERENNPFID